eukprot:TRINITY_DN63582_c0_g1_i2.p2 TRINITY_DN63582_c0_g1~~TRINITY_DN63582_c0_g1_i2.p2  ORF type:complete len:229 (+),score=17.67 TRINITY_DN63582_c0_g1_i2:82-768(+)
MRITHYTLSATDDGDHHTPWGDTRDGAQDKYRFSVVRSYQNSLQGSGVEYTEWAALLQAVNNTIELCKETIPGYDPDNHEHDVKRAVPSVPPQQGPDGKIIIVVPEAARQTMLRTTHTPHQLWVKKVVAHLNATFAPLVQSVVERAGNTYWQHAHMGRKPPEQFAQLANHKQPFQHILHCDGHDYDSITINVETHNNDAVTCMAMADGSIRPVAPPTIPENRATAHAR